MRLALAMPGRVEKTVTAQRVGPLAVHQRFDGRWQVSHIASGRATIPGGICCKSHAVALANALKGLNWEFTLNRTKKRVKFPASVKADMEKARDIASMWLYPCGKCRLPPEYGDRVMTQQCIDGQHGDCPDIDANCCECSCHLGLKPINRTASPWQKIVRAAKCGTGLRLTAEEVGRLGSDDAIQRAAEGGRE